MNLTKRSLAILGFLSLFLAATFISSPAQAPTTIDEYINQARDLNNKGKTSEAVSLLEKAIEKFPNNSDLHAYLGIYTGSLAGASGSPMQAMNLTNKAFSLLDKAVKLDDKNPVAYLYRGILSVKVPIFFGKLNDGIADLKKVIELLPKNDPKNRNTLLTAYTTLAEAYEKSKDNFSQREMLNKAISISSDSTTIKELKEKLSKIPVEVPKDAPLLAIKESDDETAKRLKTELAANPSKVKLLFELGEHYYTKERFEEAIEALKLYVSLEPSSARAYEMLAISTGKVAEKGYDERIAENTNLRSSLAFEAMNYATKAVELDPNNYHLRLLRGFFGISFPFFVGKLEQGIEDLEFVLSSDAPDSAKAEALYYMGVANQKKAMKFWREAIDKAPESEIARLAYQSMRPKIEHFDPSKYKQQVVAIDFVIGYQDELAPQTAVWIEDEDGNYVKTIYVSGFSGHAKEKQVNLPVWAAISKFKGADAVTGASIDVGHHIFLWDLKDINGKKVPRGTYKIIVESSFWPSMKYQRVEGKIKVGRKVQRTRVEEGNLIPYLEISYYPKR